MTLSSIGTQNNLRLEDPSIQMNQSPAQKDKKSSWLNTGLKVSQYVFIGLGSSAFIAANYYPDSNFGKATLLATNKITCKANEILNNNNDFLNSVAAKANEAKTSLEKLFEEIDREVGKNLLENLKQLLGD